MIHDGLFLLLETFLARLASHLELFMSILSPRLHSFLIFSCHLLAFSFVDHGIVFRPFALLIVSALHKGLVDNIYPKGCTCNLKQRYCCHRAKGHLLCYRKVGFSNLISIEHSSYVLNNVPLLFTKTSKFKQG